MQDLYHHGPDMRDSLDTFLNKTDMYDISIVSTMGLTNEDVEEVKKISGVENAIGTYSKDVAVKIRNDDKEFIFKTIGISNSINKFVLRSGKMPENNDECLVEEKFINNTKYNIGDSITFDDIDNVFKIDKLKIVGTINSPLYISMDKGSTNLGSGNIDYYLYIKEDLFEIDYYTNIYMQISSNKDKKTSSYKYRKIVNEVKERIEKIKSEREESRYKNIIEDANNELNKNIKSFEKEKKKGLLDIKSAEDKLNKAGEKIKNAEKKLKIEKKNAKNKIENAKSEILSSKNKLKASQKKYNNGRKEYKQAVEKLKIEKKKMQEIVLTIDNNITILDNKKEDIKQTINLINEQIQAGDLSNENKLKELNQSYKKIQSEILDLKKNKETINSNLILADKKLNSTKKQLDFFYKELKKAYKQIEKADAKIKSQNKITDKKFKDAKKNIFNAKETFKKRKERAKRK